MSKPDNKDMKAFSVRPASTGYEVGYGKPPANGRFKSGQSGNPKGRPKGAKNKLPALNEERLKSIILEESYRTIKINDGNKQVSVPMAQAVMRALSVKAVKGDHRAQRLFSELLTTTERENKQIYSGWFNTALDYKIAWEKELMRRRRLGIDLPDPIPHPDDLEVNLATGQIQVKGPMTKEEKVQWDLVREYKVELEAELEELQLLIDKPGRRNREKLAAEITNTLQRLGKIRKVIPD